MPFPWRTCFRCAFDDGLSIFIGRQSVCFWPEREMQWPNESHSMELRRIKFGIFTKWFLHKIGHFQGRLRSGIWAAVSIDANRATYALCYQCQQQQQQQQHRLTVSGIPVLDDLIALIPSALTVKKLHRLNSVNINNLLPIIPRIQCQIARVVTIIFSLSPSPPSSSPSLGIDTRRD